MRIPVSGESRPSLITDPVQYHSSISRSRLFACLFAMVLLCVLPQLSQAQFRASLNGTITDPTGAVIPNATVILTNPATNEMKTVTSDGSGFYAFNGLAPATYRLTIQSPGFEKKVIDSVGIVPEQANTMNIQLAPAAAAQTVTVTAAPPTLDTATANLGVTISSNEIQHMPSYNRDVFQLAGLTPGTTADASQGSSGGSYELPGNQGPGGSSSSNAGIFATENGPQVQTRGGQYETNSITVDGISTVSAVWGGTSVITPSEDSVESLRVVASDYDAEYGRFSGGQIEVTTKSGTNQLHGSFFFKASRPGLNAYQRWNGLGSEHAGTPASRGLNRDETRTNNYGGSLGGPLWKNRLFAFFNWETSPQSNSTTSQGWYETSQFDSSAPAGSIAAKYLSYPGVAPSQNGMIPRTCASIGLTEGVNCNTTSGGLDVGSPLTSALGTQDLTYGGSSNTPGVGNGLDGIPDLAYFNSVNPTTISQNQYNGRVDADVTQKDHLFFTIYWVPVESTFFNGPVRTMNLWHHSQVNDAFSVVWNHTFSPTLLNQARANAAGWRWNEVTSNPQEPFGLPQDNIDAIGTIGNENGFQFFGAPGPSNLNQWTYSYNDVLTKVLGRHNIKMGGELTRLYYLNNPVYAARPSFNFHNLWDFDNDAPYFENGTFDHSTGVPFANRQDARENLWGFFIQDDFQALPNLTINAGLRWSYFGAYYTKQDNLDVAQFGTGSNPMTGLNVRVGGKLYTPQQLNFGPQLGFAYSPTMFQNKMVVRGGFGINFNQNEIAITANGFGNPPNAVSANFNCGYPFPNPTCSGIGILYQTATSITSIFGYPPNPATITNFGPNNLPLTGTTSLTGFDSHPGTISNYHFSLDTQYQLPYNTVASVGYQGSLTRHLLVQNNYNAVAAARGFALNPVVSFFDFYTNSGSGNYNALIALVRHSFSHTFQAEAQYTYSKAMDENSGPYYEDYYPYDTHAAYGPSNYNVTNAFRLFGLWQPVFFHGNSWEEKVIGGWTLSGIWNVHSGFPFTPTYNIAGNLYTSNSGYGQLRPTSRLPGAGRSTSNKTFMQQTNPNYGGNGTMFFTSPTYVTGAPFPATSPAPPPGLHRNSEAGPGYNGVNASLAKAFGMPNTRLLGEHASLEFRVDTYNLFNKTNINAQSIDTNLGSVNPDGTISQVNSDFGVAGGALGSRTIQLQTRFSF